MKDIKAIILAAGRGTRMKSKIPKVLQELHSRPLLSFLIKTLDEVGIKKRLLVVAREDKAVKEVFSSLDMVIQKKPLGSGDAVRCTKDRFAEFNGYILVLCGDTPFIGEKTIKELIKKHDKEKPSCTLLTARTSDPANYGRIVRNSSGNIVKIVEEKNLSNYEKTIQEINVGCYCFNRKDLFEHIDKLKINPKKKEYYVTDMVEILKKNKKKICSVSCGNPTEFLGINSKVDLAEANNIVKERVLKNLMLEGVTIVDPRSTFVDMEAKIGSDTVIYPNTIIEKDVTIGKSCKVGPFARIREGSRIADSVEIGNFVELVRTKISSGTKVKHMTYLGDTQVGENVNIGAGTITANFDGKKKNKTIIENGAFIGVGSIFIAPVRVGHGAVVGAGSVVTRNRNVPPHKTVAGIPARILTKERKR